MKKFAIALVAAAGAATAANAYRVTVLVDGMAAVAGTVGESYTVSVWLDSEGASTIGGVAFDSWAGFIGTMSTSGAGGWIAPVEDNNDTDVNAGGTLGPTFVAPTDWRGRRPAEWANNFPFPAAGNSGTNGGFRSPAQTFEVNGGTLSAAGGADIQAAQSADAPNENTQNNDGLIEVFRADIVYNGGVDTISVNLRDLFTYDTTNVSGAGGLQAGASFDTATITPAPASVALLGLGGLAAARRRR